MYVPPPATAGLTDLREIHWIMDMKDIQHLEDADELNLATDCGEIYGLSSLPCDRFQPSLLGLCAGYSMSHGQYLLYRDDDDVVITMSRPTKPRSHVQSFDKFREGFLRNLSTVQRVQEKTITIITSRMLMGEYIRAKGQLPANCVVFDFWRISAVAQRVQTLRGIHRRHLLRQHFSGLTLIEPVNAEGSQAGSDDGSDEESDDAE